MKKLSIKIIAFLGVFSLFGCADDYLDYTPTELLSVNDITEAAETRPELLEGFLNGLYSTMYTTGTGGTTNHDDFGQKGWDIFTDMSSGDMVLAGVTYGWYSDVANLVVQEDNTSTRNYMPWRFYYRIIFGANNLLTDYDPNNIPELEEAQHNIGQALAMRAYCYYNLVNMFVNEYNPSTPAIPLMIDPTADAQPLSTAGEVYDQIIADLEQAVELLDGFNRSAKFMVNQDVARALLAYSYAAVGRNAEAAAQAKAVMDAGNFPLLTAQDLVFDSSTSTGGGFNDVNTPGWMWGKDITEDTGLNLISWWGQMDVYTYSYAWAGDPKVIDNDLYALIPSDDIRKKQFVGFGNRTPSNKFFHPDRVRGGQRFITTDYIYMRIEEMYLLYAETAAKSGAEGGEAGAKQALTTLLDIRVEDSSYVNDLSGQDLIDEISKQTRIEFWGEGKSYFLMKRNHETRTRGANHIFRAGETFNWNDPLLTFEIPLSEVQNNPNL